MRGKKNRDPNESLKLERLLGRKVPHRLRSKFEKTARGPDCLFRTCREYLEIEELNTSQIQSTLNYQCSTIEHQIIALRQLTQLNPEDYSNRLSFVVNFLNCILKHHNVIYEATLFGSTLNGLGFRDSDVDLRLCPMAFYQDCGLYEPAPFNEKEIDDTLRNISYNTTRCHPCSGEFHASSRCPVAKLTFQTGGKTGNVRSDVKLLKKGLSCDVTMLTGNGLVGLNTKLLRFFCFLEPKFHLLATIVKYWARVHELIQPGQLSSYALINMLIFFCQQQPKPLLPTINLMRDKYFKNTNIPKHEKQGLLKNEWNCMICLQKGNYQEFGKNQDLVCILFFRFLEFYLNFHYMEHIISISTGNVMTHDEFRASNLYHPSYAIKSFLNIQDPFDLTHNLTRGMDQKHFGVLINVIRQSYEKLFVELLNNFDKPKNGKADGNWGLTVILSKFPASKSK